MAPRRPTRSDEVPEADAREQAESISGAGDEDDSGAFEQVAARDSEVPAADALEQALVARDPDDDWRDGDD